MVDWREIDWKNLDWQKLAQPEFESHRIFLEPALVKIGNTELKRRSAWQHSAIEQELAEDLEAEGSDHELMSKAALQEVSFPSLCAYFLCKQLELVLGSKVVTPAKLWEDFKDFLLKMEVEKKPTTVVMEQDFDFLSEYVEQYAETRYGHSSITKAQILSGLLLFNKNYQTAMKSLVRTPVSAHKNIQNPLVAENIITLQSMRMLEHFARQYGTQDPPPLWVLQNELVRKGLLFQDKAHWLFQGGVWCTAVDIFQQDLGRLAAWYLTEKVVAYCEEFNTTVLPQDEEEKNGCVQKLSEELYQEFSDYQTADYQTSSTELLRRFDLIMPKMAIQYGFKRNEIFQWRIGFGYIADAFNLYKAVLQEPTSSKKPRIFILGDSVAAGKGVSKPWVTWMSERLERDGVSCECVNRSLYGYEARTAVSHLEAIQKEIEIYKPDLVFGTLGGNDFLTGVTIEDLQMAIEQLIGFFQEKNLIVVWAAGIPDTVRRDENEMTAYEAMLCSIEKSKGITILRLPRAILSAANMQQDGIHFNEDIQPAIAEAACQGLEKIIRTIQEIKYAPRQNARRGGATDPVQPINTKAADVVVEGGQRHHSVGSLSVVEGVRLNAFLLHRRASHAGYSAANDGYRAPVRKEAFSQEVTFQEGLKKKHNRRKSI